MSSSEEDKSTEEKSLEESSSATESESETESEEESLEQKERLSAIIARSVSNLRSKYESYLPYAKTAFHYGFVPFVLFLGMQTKGNIFQLSLYYISSNVWGNILISIY